MEHAAGATFQLMDPRSLLGGAAFFLSFAVGVGFVVFRLLSHPASRRAPFRTWGAWRRSRSALVGLLLASTIFTALVSTSIGGFHRVVAREDSVDLVYALPPWTVTLSAADVAGLSFESSTAARSWLVIETRDGSSYRSVPARGNLLSALKRRLEKTR